MSFVHPLLLGGLLLVGVPVLIHLVMRQKPKQLPFPALRFLRPGYRSNQRRLRLNHLLLLALRMLLVAAVCLALANPKLFSERFGLTDSRPVAAVLVVDTSLSMGYTVRERTRLDEAVRLARELLAELPAGSRVAVLDSATSGGEWLDVRQADERLEALRLSPVNGPVTRQLGQGYRLFDALEQEGGDGEPLPRFLYVFSDRTTACWDAGEAKGLQRPDGVRVVFVDVGVDEPADLAIDRVEVPRPVVNPGDTVEIRVTVRAAGTDCDNEISCRIDGEATGDRRPLKLRAGQSQVLVFERYTARPGEPAGAANALGPGLHQAEIRLGSGDSLPVNNTAYATIRVQEGRRVLVIADQPEGDAALWVKALRASRVFPCDVMSAAEVNAKRVLPGPATYRAVCLLNVADPAPLWDRLADFVRKGGGLAVVPGGAGWTPQLDGYASAQAKELLGAQLVQVEMSKEESGALVSELADETPRPAGHPLLAPFRQWRQRDDVDFFEPEKLPRANRFWKVKRADGTTAVLTYAAADSPPALLEHTHGAGRVLLFTTPLDGRRTGNRQWNNFLESSFYPCLVCLAVGHLAGDAEMPPLNYLCGEVPVVALPPAPFRPAYTVVGPGLSGADANLSRGEGQTQIRVLRAAVPGSYEVLDDQSRRVAGFSINVRPEECLLDRVPAPDIEGVLGDGVLLPVEHGLGLKEALQGHWQQPVELFGVLMLTVLALLVIESLLANRFYRREPTAPAPSPLPLSPATGERGRGEGAGAGAPEALRESA